MPFSYDITIIIITHKELIINWFQLHTFCQAAYLQASDALPDNSTNKRVNTIFLSVSLETRIWTPFIFFTLRNYPQEMAMSVIRRKRRIASYTAFLLSNRYPETQPSLFRKLSTLRCCLYFDRHSLKERFYHHFWSEASMNSRNRL